MRLTGEVILAGMMAMAVCRAELPQPATGGKDGGPLDLLLICGHSEWAFGKQPELDPKYAAMLAERGYRVTSVREWQSLNLPFLRQFNAVVYLNPSAYRGGGYYDDTRWRGGCHLLTVERNADILREFIAEGGGVLFVPTLEEFGTRGVETFNHLFAPYGLETACAVAMDPVNNHEAARVGFQPILYSWTDRIGDHPATRDVKRIYYPSYCTRWDDNYTTIPLKPHDPAWTVLARGMPGSRSRMLRSSIYSPDMAWTAMDGWDEPVVMAARPYGKGRMAVIGISAWHLFYVTYAEKGDVSESTFSRVAGIAMSEGDGVTGSDLHRLLDNTYRWLGEGSLPGGMGGYTPDGGPAAGPMPVLPDHQVVLADTWADRDPRSMAGCVRPMRILVGVRSAISSGKGTPEAWARAAREAGYDVVCFTETYEHLKQEQWDAFVAECRLHSDAGVELVPGFDVPTDLGDRFLLVGAPALIRSHLLTPDRRTLFWTGHMMLGIGDVLPVIARPQWLARERGGNGALSPDLYAHFAGVAVATYKDGERVDDGFAAYKWHVDNASLPYPIAVHEVDDPGKLARAAQEGLQSYVNSDSPANAAHYFRNSFGASGGNPARYYVSSGPLVGAYGIDDWQASPWKMRLSVRSASPIVEVRVSDQRRVYRRWTPQATAFEAVWHGDLGAQHWFIGEVRDAAGGHCILPPVRTLPPYHYVRCLDRQNFFGFHSSWLTYVGRMPGHGGRIEVPGVTLAAPVIPKPQLRYTGNRLTVLDWVIDSTQVPGGTHWNPETGSMIPGGRAPGADNAPMCHETVLPAYSARIRFLTLRRREGRNIFTSPVRYTREAEVRLKQDLVVQGDLWPVLGKTEAKGTFAFRGPDGKPVTGTLTNGVVDLPAGGRINTLVALTPLRVDAAGLIGLPAINGAVAPSGTLYQVAFTMLDAQALALAEEGGGGVEVALTQGRQRLLADTLFLTADQEGVAGTISETGGGTDADTEATRGILRGVGLTLRLAGANPRWAAGLWQPGVPLDPYNMLDGELLGTIVTGPDPVPFYFGNFLTSDNRDLNLSFAGPWTGKEAVIEVNNPTDGAIEARVRTPRAITDRLVVDAIVHVPAGSSRTLILGAGTQE